MTQTHSTRWTGGALLALLVLIGTSFWWVRQASGAAAHAFQPDNPTVLALGKRVYQAQCASCHGAQLQGQVNWRERGPDGLLPAPPHDASGHTWHHPDEQLFAIVKYGIQRVINKPEYRTLMPAYEGVLSDEEIVAVLSWIKSHWAPEIRERHDAINAQAQQR